MFYVFLGEWHECVFRYVDVYMYIQMYIMRYSQYYGY